MPARIVRLSRADEPALAPFVAIREKDLVLRQGHFIAEGEVVVRVLARDSSFPVRALLLEERRVAPLADVIERLEGDVPVYVVPQSVMDSVVGFAIHRGVLALGERPPAPSVEELLVGAKLVVGLVGLTNHDNVGGIFRSAAAFGADAILLDAESCDPLYRKAIRVSAGAALLVPFARCVSGEAMLDVLAQAGLEPLALSPRGARDLTELRRGRYGLLLGSEGPGLPDAIMARASTVRISMADGFDSLNVAVAGAIALHACATAT